MLGEKDFTFKEMKRCSPKERRGQVALVPDCFLIPSASLSIFHHVVWEITLCLYNKFTVINFSQFEFL